MRITERQIRRIISEERTRALQLLKEQTGEPFEVSKREENTLLFPLGSQKYRAKLVTMRPGQPTDPTTRKPIPNDPEFYFNPSDGQIRFEPPNKEWFQKFVNASESEQKEMTKKLEDPKAIASPKTNWGNSRYLPKDEDAVKKIMDLFPSYKEYLSDKSNAFTTKQRDIEAKQQEERDQEEKNASERLKSAIYKRIGEKESDAVERGEVRRGSKEHNELSKRLTGEAQDLIKNIEEVRSKIKKLETKISKTNDPDDLETFKDALESLKDSLEDIIEPVKEISDQLKEAENLVKSLKQKRSELKQKQPPEKLTKDEALQLADAIDIVEKLGPELEQARRQFGLAGKEIKGAEQQVAQVVESLRIQRWNKLAGILKG